MATVQTLYVNADGSGDFTTIKAALDSIKTNTGDADVTYELVLNGKFDEAVNLDSYNDATWGSDKNITFKKSDAAGAVAVITGRVQIGYTASPGNKDIAHAWDGDVTFEGVTFDYTEATDNKNRFEILASGKNNEVKIVDCTFEGPGMINAGYNAGDPSNNNGDPNGDNAGNLLCTPWKAATDGYQGKLTVSGTSFNNGNINFWRNGSGWSFTDCDFNNAPVTLQGNPTKESYTFTDCSFSMDLAEVGDGIAKYLIGMDENGLGATIENAEMSISGTVAEGEEVSYILSQAPNADNNNTKANVSLTDVTVSEIPEGADFIITKSPAETTVNFTNCDTVASTFEAENLSGVTAEDIKGAANVNIENEKADGSKDIIITDDTGDGILVGKVDGNEFFVDTEKSANYQDMAVDYANNLTGEDYKIFVIDANGMKGYTELATAVANALTGAVVIVKDALGAGDINVNGKNLTVTGTATGAGTWKLEDALASTVTFDKNANIATTQLIINGAGQTMNIAGTVSANGVYNKNASELNVTGKLTIDNYLQISGATTVEGKDAAVEFTNTREQGNIWIGAKKDYAQASLEVKDGAEIEAKSAILVGHGSDDGYRDGKIVVDNGTVSASEIQISSDSEISGTSVIDVDTLSVGNTFVQTGLPLGNYKLSIGEQGKDAAIVEFNNQTYVAYFNTFADGSNYVYIIQDENGNAVRTGGNYVIVNAVLTVDYTSSLNFTTLNAAKETISIDMTGYDAVDADKTNRILNFKGTGMTLADYEVVVKGDNFLTADRTDGAKFVEANGDLYVTDQDQSILYVNDEYNEETALEDNRIFNYNAFATVNDAMLVAQTLGGATIDLTDDGKPASYAAVTDNAAIWRTNGTYKFINGNYADLATWVDTARDSDTTDIDIIFENAKVIAGKFRLDTGATLTITNSHMDARSYIGDNRAWTTFYGDAAINITNSVVGYHATYGNGVSSDAIVAGDKTTDYSQHNAGMVFNGSGVMTVTNSTIFAYTDTTNGAGALAVYDRGLMEFKNSAVYAHSFSVGYPRGGSDDTIGRDGEVATMVLDNSVMRNINGDPQFELRIGSDTLTGKLVLKNGAELIHGATMIVAKDSSVDINASTLNLTSTVTNKGTFSANNAVINVDKFNQHGGTATFTNVDLKANTFNNEPNGGTYAIVGGTSKIQIDNATGSYALRLADDTVLKGGSYIYGSCSARAQGDITFGEAATDFIHIDSFDTRDSYNNDFANTQTITVNGTLDISETGKGFDTYWLGIYGSEKADDASVATVLTGAGTIDSNTATIFQYGKIVVDKDLTINVTDQYAADFRITLTDMTIKGKINGLGSNNKLSCIQTSTVTVTGENAALNIDSYLLIGYQTYKGNNDTSTTYKSSVTVEDGAAFTVGGKVYLNQESSINIADATFTAGELTSYDGIITVTGESILDIDAVTGNINLGATDKKTTVTFKDVNGGNLILNDGSEIWLKGTFNGGSESGIESSAYNYADNKDVKGNDLWIAGDIRTQWIYINSASTVTVTGSDSKLTALDSTGKEGNINVYGGKLTVKDGLAQTANANVSGTVEITGGTLKAGSIAIAQGQNGDQVSGLVTVTGGGTIDMFNGSITVGAVFDDKKYAAGKPGYAKLEIIKGTVKIDDDDDIGAGLVIAEKAEVYAEKGTIQIGATSAVATLKNAGSLYLYDSDLEADIVDNDKVIYIKGGSTFTAGTVDNTTGEINLTWNSDLTMGEFNGQAIKVDADGFAANTLEKVIDMTGTDAITDDDYVINGAADGIIYKGDLYLSTVDTSTIYLNADYADSDDNFGKKYAEGIYGGVNAFDSLAEAIAAGNDIVVSGDKVVESGAARFEGEDFEIAGKGTIGVSEEIVVKNSTVTVSGDITFSNNTGKNYTLNINRGELAISGNVTAEGIEVTTNGALNIQNGASLTNDGLLIQGGEVTVSGTLTVEDNGTNKFYVGYKDATGVLTVDGGTLTSEVSAVINDTLNIKGASTINVTNATVAGTINVVGATLSGSTLDATGAGKLFFGGDNTLTGSDISFAGNVEIEGALSVENDSTLTVGTVIFSNIATYTGAAFDTKGTVYIYDANGNIIATATDVEIKDGSFTLNDINYIAGGRLPAGDYTFAFVDPTSDNKIIPNGTITFEAGTLTVDLGSMVEYTGSIDGKVILDAAGFTGNYYKFVDYTGTGTGLLTTDDIVVVNGETSKLFAAGGDIFYGEVAQDYFYVNGAWAGSQEGDIVADHIFGINASDSFIVNSCAEYKVVGDTTVAGTLDVDKNIVIDNCTLTVGSLSSKVSMSVGSVIEWTGSLAGSEVTFDWTGIGTDAIKLFDYTGTNASAITEATYQAIIKSDWNNAYYVVDGDLYFKLSEATKAQALGGMVNTIDASGVTKVTESSDNYVGGANITVTGMVAGGEVVSATEGWYYRTGDINTTINGGTFNKRVYGGMFKNNDSALNVITLNGNINTTINGGTFKDYVYGGHGLSNVDVATITQKGNINLTIDSSDNAITFEKTLVAGSIGNCVLQGNINVTITGDEDVTMKQLWGSNAGGYYREPVTDNAEMDYHNVTGTRTLAFDDFSGDFTSGAIVGFQKVKFSDSEVDFAGVGAMYETTGWEMDWNSEISNFDKHNFDGDTLAIDLTGWTNVGQTLISGESVDSLLDLDGLTIGGVNATLTGNVWLAGSYKFTINTDTNTAVLTLA
ncbi:MAG: hypothetical protein IKB16_05310 [Lentisphaeria bacterium]|nr:hypothetical protein [Lentisphaeria bacterium]